MLLKVAAAVEEAMEWIDEEEQRRKKAAAISASKSAAVQSPEEGGPLTVDDFMSQWLHPNWSHVSCVAKIHLSPDQARLPLPFLPPRNRPFLPLPNVTHFLCSAKIEERALYKCRYLSPRMHRKVNICF